MFFQIVYACENDAGVGCYQLSFLFRQGLSGDTVAEAEKHKPHEATGIFFQRQKKTWTSKSSDSFISSQPLAPADSFSQPDIFAVSPAYILGVLRHIMLFLYDDYIHWPTYIEISNLL